MAVDIVVGSLEFAKVLMSAFIMGYAYFFLRRTESVKERRPWEHLYIASLFLFIVEVISTLLLFRPDDFKHQFVHNLRSFVEFGFLCFFLFSFIYQHSLIRRRKAIVIEEKPIITLIDRIKAMFKRAKHKIDEKPPEEELDSEVSTLEEDVELQQEEEEIEHMIHEIEKSSEDQEGIVKLAERLIVEAEKLMLEHGNRINIEKAERLKKDLKELRDMIKADEQDLVLIAKKIQEITGGDGLPTD